jgi:hypothetical protein
MNGRWQSPPLFVWLLLTGAFAIMWTTDWLDPNWRHELSNALIAWIAVGILAGVASLVWWSVRRLPHLSLAVAIVVGAMAGAAIAAMAWLIFHRASTVQADASELSLSVSIESVAVTQVSNRNKLPRWTLQNRQLIDSQNRQFLRAAETGEVLLRRRLRAQVGVDFGAPASGPALEHVGVM